MHETSVTIGAWSLDDLVARLRGHRLLDGPFQRAIPVGASGEERIQHYAYIEPADFKDGG